MSKPLSTSLELERYLGKSIYAELLSTVPDKRQIFRVAANHLGVSELDIFIELSDRLRIPVLTRLTDDFERISVSGVHENEYTDRAFVFFRTKTGLHGIACVDPAWLTPWTNRLTQFPTVLMPWQFIQNWLIDWDHTPDDIHSKIVHTGPVTSSDPGKALSALVSGLANLGVSSASVEFFPGRIVYRIIGPDLRTRTGEIKNLAAEGVEEMIALTLVKYPHTIESEIEGIPVTITVSDNPTRRQFYIQWTPELPRTLAIKRRMMADRPRHPGC